MGIIDYKGFEIWFEPSAKFSRYSIVLPIQGGSMYESEIIASDNIDDVKKEIDKRL